MTAIALAPSTGTAPARAARSGTPDDLARRVSYPPVPGADRILTPHALALVVELHDRFAPRHAELMAARRRRRRSLADGEPLALPSATRGIREEPSWRVPWAAPGLEDRRVEITAPARCATAIAALNSGANVWVADLEAVGTRRFVDVVAGQLTLRATARRTLEEACGQGPTLHAGDLPTLMVRPRAWHLAEEHLRIDGRPTVGALVDVALHLAHNAVALLVQGSGPSLSLPRLEGRAEARLWNDVLLVAERRLGIERGSVRAAVPIQTVTAALEMEEILFELRERSAGLVACRGDLLVSVADVLRGRAGLATRSARALGPAAPLMRELDELLVGVSHRRGGHAIGGTAGFVPVGDPRRDAGAEQRVRAEKQREADLGFDGARVTHPGAVPVVREVFDGVLGFVDHQIRPDREVPTATAADLLDAVARSAVS